MWDTQTGRSKFIRDFQNFVGPNPVRGSKILTSYGPWIPDIGFTWRSNVWSRKQFEVVQYSMFDMFHKCTFGPDSPDDHVSNCRYGPLSSSSYPDFQSEPKLWTNLETNNKGLYLA